MGTESSGDHESKGVVPPQPTAGISAPAKTRNMLLALAGISGAVLVVALASWIGFRLLVTPGSTANDEVNSAKKQVADFAAWSAALRAINTSGELPVSKKDVKADDSDDEKVSAWDKWFVLPNENAVQAALMRRLPKEVKLVSLTPVSYDKSGDEISVNYVVTARLKSAIYLVPVSALHFNDPLMAKYQSLTRYILASTDLPPGYTYDETAAKQISEGRQNIVFSWRINRAVIDEGKWRVLDADPIFLQQIPSLEQRLVTSSGGRAMVLRTQGDLDSMAPVRTEALTAFATRLKSIDDQVAQYRAQKMANVPPPVSRSNAKFGGSGSGEPTRSAERIGGGAAIGAASGAAFTGGSGEAAGIGAGAGLLGGLIYDGVSKSNDKKKFEAAQERDYQERLAARNAVVKTAENDINAYQQQLISSYEQELSAAAQQRVADLKAREGKS